MPYLTQDALDAMRDLYRKRPLESFQPVCVQQRNNSIRALIDEVTGWRSAFPQLAQAAPAPRKGSHDAA